MVLRKVISKVVFSFGILFFSIIPIVNSSYADFYSYVDQKGVHHYTNIPPTDKKYKLKRSEERRVGKECRSRWSRYHSKIRYFSGNPRPLHGPSPRPSRGGPGPPIS